jgi:hypothetical protein
MKITIYNPTSANKAGAIKAGTGKLYQCKLQFDRSENSKNLPPGMPAELTNAISINNAISSYSIGLSGATFSTLTSINVANNHIFIDSSTGFMTISAQTPAVSAFTLFAKTAATSWSRPVTLSAIVPITFLSSANVSAAAITPKWDLPLAVVISLCGDSIPSDTTSVSLSDTYSLAFNMSSFTELDRVIAKYTSIGTSGIGNYSFNLERNYSDSTWDWHLVNNKTQTTLYKLSATQKSSTGTSVTSASPHVTISGLSSLSGYNYNGVYTLLGLRPTGGWPLWAKFSGENQLGFLSYDSDLNRWKLIALNPNPAPLGWNPAEGGDHELYITVTQTQVLPPSSNTTLCNPSTALNWLNLGWGAPILSGGNYGCTGSSVFQLETITYSLSNAVWLTNANAVYPAGRLLVPISYPDEWFTWLNNRNSGAISDDEEFLSGPDAPPRIIMPDNIIMATDNLRAVTFMISATNMEPFQKDLISGYEIQTVEDGVEDTPASSIFCNKDTGMVFAPVLESGVTTLKITATNKYGTSQFKTLNLIVGPSTELATLSANFEQNYKPASKLFKKTARLRHVVKGNFFDAVSSSNDQYRVAKTIPSWINSEQNRNIYTYAADINEFNYNVKASVVSASPMFFIPPLAGTDANAGPQPLLLKFNAGVPFGAQNQLMYWGITTGENNKLSRYTPLSAQNPNDVSYFYVNPNNSSTPPLTGWLRPMASNLTSGVTFKADYVWVSLSASPLSAQTIPVTTALSSMYTSARHEAQFSNISQVVRFNIPNNIIPVVGGGYWTDGVPTSGTYTRISINAAGLPVYELDNPSYYATFSKAALNDPWVFFLQGPGNLSWSQSVSGENSSLPPIPGLSALSSVTVNTPKPTLSAFSRSLSSQYCVDVEDLNASHLKSAGYHNNVFGSFFGRKTINNPFSLNENIVCAEVYTDSYLRNQYDAYNYLTKDVIDSKVRQYSRIVDSFYRRNEYTLGSLVLPNPPSIVNYDYQLHETLEFHVDYINKLQTTNLALTYGVLLAGKAWLSLRPQFGGGEVLYVNAGESKIVNSSHTGAYYEYDSLPDGDNGLKTLYWTQSSIGFPRLIGNVNGIGHFGPLSAKCYWGIQESDYTFSAVCSAYYGYDIPEEGVNFGLEPTGTGWLRLSSGGPFTSTRFYGNQLSAVPPLIEINPLGRFVDPTLEQVSYFPKFFLCTIQEQLNKWDAGRVLIFQTDLIPEELYNLDSYISTASEYTPERVLTDPTMSYGTGSATGEERVNLLASLGYL